MTCGQANPERPMIRCELEAGHDGPHQAEALDYVELVWAA